MELWFLDEESSYLWGRRLQQFCPGMTYLSSVKKAFIFIPKQRHQAVSPD